MVRPTGFFRSMPVSGPQCGPVSYALIPGTIGFGAGLFWQGLIALGMGMAGGEVNRREMGIYLLLVPFSPLIILLGLYVGTAILHFFLWMVGGARNGIGATFRVVCYANGIQILNAIPFCGGPIGAVWVLVAEVIGIREAHETTTGRALAAVLLPLAVCCGFAAIVGILAAILIPAYVSAAKGGL
ncbi:MAG: YIP1 family protein [Nitrospirae bacterium]|nr:YIP1 family protein [Nitrospirota bacterium]